MSKKVFPVLLFRLRIGNDIIVKAGYDYEYDMTLINKSLLVGDMIYFSTKRRIRDE